MLSKRQINIISSIFSNHPVDKAWVFGSFARNEETSSSDVDLLVKYTPDSAVSLFTVGGLYMDLKEVLNREIDLVEDGRLYPYAQKTADKDKILIYERKN